MIQRIARDELRKAEEDGFCGFCLTEKGNDKRIAHQRDCKAVQDSGRKRVKR